MRIFYRCPVRLIGTSSRLDDAREAPGSPVPPERGRARNGGGVMDRDQIVIVTNQDDSHADAVIRALVGLEAREDALPAAP
jgi:hypothetical protein